MKPFGLFMIVVLLAGCSLVPRATPAATFVPDFPQRVTITTADEIALTGYLYPAENDLAVVFAHMGISDQTSWSEFAGEIAGRGVTALTFDFRCFGESGCSSGDEDRLHLLDVQAAIAFLNGRGYERIACMGASLGAAACLNVSMVEELAGLAFIAGGLSTPIDGRLYPQDMLNPDMPKLFLVADQDPYSVAITATQSFYERSPEPKMFITYPDVAHGTDLFKTQSKDAFNQDLLDFILSLR